MIKIENSLNFLRSVCVRQCSTFYQYLHIINVNVYNYVVLYVTGTNILEKLTTLIHFLRFVHYCIQIRAYFNLIALCRIDFNMFNIPKAYYLSSLFLIKKHHIIVQFLILCYLNSMYFKSKSCIVYDKHVMSQSSSCQSPFSIINQRYIEALL